MWQVLMRMAVPAIIKSVEEKVGKEVLDVMRAAIQDATQSGLSGDEARPRAWANTIKEWGELKMAVAEEVADGVPWFLNFAFEALVAKSKLGASKGK
jgi:hypothetical protein